MARLNGGDKLASGAVKASFGPVEKVSDEKWAEAFDDFNPEEYRRLSNRKKTGVPSTSIREATKR